jgi:hypothetical protein
MVHQPLLDPRNVPEALVVHAQLERLLGELDRLGLDGAGAHLSLAIHILERRIMATGRMSFWPEPETLRPS